MPKMIQSDSKRMFLSVGHLFEASYLIMYIAFFILTGDSARACATTCNDTPVALQDKRSHERVVLLCPRISTKAVHLDEMICDLWDSCEFFEQDMQNVRVF